MGQYKVTTEKGSYIVTTEGTDITPQSQTIAQKLYAPIRAARAAGVGLGNMIMQGYPQQEGNPQPTGGQAVLDRMKAAFQPGFKPQPEEVVPALLGEGAGAAGAIVGGTALASVGIPASIGTDMALGAISQGGLSALQQASEQGKVKIKPSMPTSFLDLISPDSVIGNAAFGAAMPLISPTLQALKNSAVGMESRAMGATFADRKLPMNRVNVDAAAKNALQNKLFPSLGNPQVAEVNAINYKNKVGDALNKMRESVGDIPTLDAIEKPITKLEGLRQDLTKGSTGGQWNAIHAKINAAQST